MTDIRTRAAYARSLMDDARLTGFLQGIEEQAQADFLASRGDPAALTAAWRKADAVQTLRAALQSAIDAQTVADHSEKRRGT